MLLLTFHWNKLFHVYFFIVFFYSNARKFRALLIESLFPPWDIPPRKSQISSQISPFPQPHPQAKKIPLKTSVHFPITITVCKHWSMFVTCSPSPRDCGGVIHPQRHSYYGFRLCGTKWLSQNFDPLTSGKKWAWEGA